MNHWTQLTLTRRVHDRWGYLLASETVIKSATTWDALKNGGQAFQ